MKQNEESEIDQKSYSDDYALYYELIICRAYNCNRYGVNAADADIYRHLLESYWHFKDSVDKGYGIEDAKCKYNENCKQISDNLYDAISKLNNGSNFYSEIIATFPQTTVDDINSVIDRIIEKNRQ